MYYTNVRCEQQGRLGVEHMGALYNLGISINQKLSKNKVYYKKVSP